MRGQAGLLELQDWAYDAYESNEGLFSTPRVSSSRAPTCRCGMCCTLFLRPIAPRAAHNNASIRIAKPAAPGLNSSLRHSLLLRVPHHKHCLLPIFGQSPASHGLSTPTSLLSSDRERQWCPCLPSSPLPLAWLTQVRACVLSGSHAGRLLRGTCPLGISLGLPELLWPQKSRCVWCCLCRRPCHAHAPPVPPHTPRKHTRAVRTPLSPAHSICAQFTQHTQHGCSKSTACWTTQTLCADTSMCLPLHMSLAEATALKTSPVACPITSSMPNHQ